MANYLFGRIKQLDVVWIFCGFLAFFVLSVIPQKLEFYSLQNAVVESLVERHAWGMQGASKSENENNWFFQNIETHTPQLVFVGDVYPYKNLWYPAKSYGPQYAGTLVYAFLYHILGLTFQSHYLLVSTILLIFTSFMLVSSGGTLTYMAAKYVTGNRLKALFVSISLVFGSLLTGGINIRNEETFGYWIFICVYALTFLPLKHKVWPIVLTLLLYYSVFSLPIVILLMPLGLFRIYQSGGKNVLKTFILTNILCIGTIFVHNFLIFGRFVFSNYTIGEELNPGYRLGQFAFSWPNWIEKLQFYFLNPQTSILTNYPLIILGFTGIWMSKQSTLTKLVTFATVLGFAFYITNIGELTGWVGFGSGRYML
ncbi:MAG: hypothetical protein AAB874_00360, partial [Patescibacteria group bacterium]